MQSAAVIRTDEQLAQSVRLGSILRMPWLELTFQAGASFRSVDDLKRRLSIELERYCGHLQIFSWYVAAGAGLFGLSCQLHTSYYDGSEDRLFVRRRVYSRAMALCGDGKPELGRVCMAARQDMAYGKGGANPHCVSAALRERRGVCQAISLYLCQLLLRCGYPCVVRTGTVNGVGHCWNQVWHNGAWRRLDLCVAGPAEYRDETRRTPQEQYGAMTSFLQRRVRLYEKGAEVEGIRPPFFIADRRWVCPTRFVQCFNGAWLREGNELILCLGAQIRRIPLSALRETAAHVPCMEVGRFAELFGLRYERDCLLFTEGL